MRHKLGLIGFSYLAGLICAEFFGTFTIGVFTVAALLLISAVAVIKSGKSASTAVALFTVSAAMSVHGIYTLTVYIPVIECAGKTAEINGTITDVRYYGHDTAAYTIKTDINGAETGINMFGEDNAGEIGDNIRITVKLSLLKDNQRFAEKSYYKPKNIFLSASPKSKAEIIPSGKFSVKKLLSDYSDYIGQKIGLLLTGEEGDILNAIFLGDRTGLSDGLSENIKRAGVSHFTAVSGLHLTLISHIILLIISLTPLKRHRYLKFSVLAVLILLFILFFRLSHSVVRAGIMLIIYYGSEPFMRKSNVFNSTGAAALLITLCDPYACTDAGLLMSLAGTLGVGAASTAAAREFGKGRFSTVKRAFIASLSAILCTFPLSCVYFGGFSAVGAVTNFILYPLFLPALACAALFAMLGGNGSILIFLAGLCAKGMIRIINLFGNFKYAYFPLDYAFIAPVSFLSAIFILLVHFRFKDLRKTLKAISLSVCVMLFLTAVCDIYFYDKAKLTMYSDGDDACIIAEHMGSVFIAVSDDSPKLLQNINDYMKNNFIEEVSALTVLNANHNAVSRYSEIPCKIFIPPETQKEVYTDKITMYNQSDICTLTINGVSVSLSPAKDPLDNNISVLYGYTGKTLNLSGTVFVSSKRLDGAEGRENVKNLYYEKASYIVTANGFLSKRNQG